MTSERICMVLTSLLPVRHTEASNMCFHPQCGIPSIYAMPNACLQLYSSGFTHSTHDASDSCESPVVHHRNFLSLKSAVYVMLFHMHLCFLFQPK